MWNIFRRNNGKEQHSIEEKQSPVDVELLAKYLVTRFDKIEAQ